MRSKTICNFEGCKAKATKQLTLSIKDKKSSHYYCGHHALKADVTILQASVFGGTVGHVKTEVSDL